VRLRAHQGGDADEYHRPGRVAPPAHDPQRSGPSDGYPLRQATAVEAAQAPARQRLAGGGGEHPTSPRSGGLREDHWPGTGPIGAHGAGRGRPSPGGRAGRRAGDGQGQPSRAGTAVGPPSGRRGVHSSGRSRTAGDGGQDGRGHPWSGGSDRRVRRWVLARAGPPRAGSERGGVRGRPPGRRGVYPQPGRHNGGGAAAGGGGRHSVRPHSGHRAVPPPRGGRSSGAGQGAAHRAPAQGA
jgi:hypothetical protein